MEKFNKKRLYIEIVKAIEGIVTIKEFEQWLYAQTELQEQMDDDVFVWEVFTLRFKNNKWICMELEKLMITEVKEVEVYNLLTIKEILFDVVMSFSFWKINDINEELYRRFISYKCLDSLRFFDDSFMFEEFFDKEKVKNDYLRMVQNFLLQLYQAESQTENFTLKDFVYKEQTR